MVERLMIKCDNPKCSSIGEPEFVPGQYGPKKRGQRVMGPYGWHQGDAWIVGCGPSFVYMACSTECVGPAVMDLLEQARRKERGEYE
jgi:hypothetical protein